jgi:hypothetical protein
MIATSNHVYAGRAIRPGEEIDVEAEHVNLWILLGRAKLKEQPDMTYGTRALTARRGKRSVQ